MRAALADHRIFRVRQGWYSVPDAPQQAIRAVRVGGRLTSLSALESYGLPVPRRPTLHIAVPATGSRLRRPDDRFHRLRAHDEVRVHWTDRRGGGTNWRVSIDDALLAVLLEEPRDIAIACCSAVLRHKRWSSARLDSVFRRAPRRVRGWYRLASELDDSHGETFARLWFGDVGIAVVQQVEITGVGRFDFQVGPHSFVEIDGGQHDPNWTGESMSSWAEDNRRTLAMGLLNNRIVRVSYLQLYTQWSAVLQLIDRMLADAAALDAYRRRHPYRPRRRRSRVSVSAGVRARRT